jgi:curli biogenesis system outer membrane secretion channel CsgG
LVLYYLGLIALQQQRNDDALRDLQQYVKEDPEGAKERDIAKLLTVLTSSELQREVQRAVSQEKDLSAQPPEPGSIAIQTFANQSAPEAAVLAKGFAAMVISDLSKVPGLKVLEREKVQKISDELRLNASDLVAPDSAVRLGRLMRAERVVVGNIGVE